MDNGFLSFFNIKRWLLFLRLSYNEDIIDDSELDIIQNNKNIDISDDLER